MGTLMTSTQLVAAVPLPVTLMTTTNLVAAVLLLTPRTIIHTQLVAAVLLTLAIPTWVVEVARGTAAPWLMGTALMTYTTAAMTTTTMMMITTMMTTTQLVEAARITAPRFGPRLEARVIEPTPRG